MFSRYLGTPEEFIRNAQQHFTNFPVNAYELYIYDGGANSSSSDSSGSSDYSGSSGSSGSYNRVDELLLFNILFKLFSMGYSFTQQQVEDLNRYAPDSIDKLISVFTSVLGISEQFIIDILYIAANTPTALLLPQIYLSREQFDNFINFYSFAGMPSQYSTYFRDSVSTFPVSAITLYNIISKPPSSSDYSGSSDYSSSSFTNISRFGAVQANPFDQIFFKDPQYKLMQAFQDFICKNPEAKSVIDKLTTLITLKQEGLPTSVGELDGQIAQQMSYSSGIPGLSPLQNATMMKTLRQFYHDVFVLFEDQYGIISTQSMNNLVNSIPKIICGNKSS
jgi:hypothetical protein